VIVNRPLRILYDPTEANIFWESGIYNSSGVYHTSDGGQRFHHLGSVKHAHRLLDVSRQCLRLGVKDGRSLSDQGTAMSAGPEKQRALEEALFGFED